MASFLNRYIIRDREMQRQDKDIKQAQSNLIKQGNTPKQALKKIKKSFLQAIKEKFN